MASADQAGYRSFGDFIPTFFLLNLFAVLWGLLQYRDGTQFIGLALAAPLALGMLSSASVRMLLGRGFGGVFLTFGGGTVLFMVMMGISVVAGMLTQPEGQDFALEPLWLGLGGGLGIFGALFGAVALKHYLAQEQEELDDDEDLEEDDGEDIDYSTEPEDLVCLLTNQVVNRDHDRYVVCHNRFNVTSVCHAVYLKDYVHLLDNRCRRCYQPLRERDLKGM